MAGKLLARIFIIVLQGLCLYALYALTLSEIARLLAVILRFAAFIGTKPAARRLGRLVRIGFGGLATGRQT